MLKDEDEVLCSAAAAADELTAAIRTGRTADARALLPVIGAHLTALGADSDLGIEEARKTLGELARAARDEGAVTWLTTHRVRVAAIVPVPVAEAGLQQQEGL
jgi:hypothetical protein